MGGWRLVVALGVACSLAGCVTAGNPANEPWVWSHFDCHDSGPGEYDQARTICLGRAQAAATAGTAGMPSGRGIGGAIVAGINQGITYSQIGSATATSCMAELGYARRTASDTVKACPQLEGKLRTKLAALRAEKGEAAGTAATVVDQ